MTTVHILSSTESGRRDASEILTSIGQEFKLHYSIRALMDAVEDAEFGCVLVTNCCDLFMDEGALREGVFDRFGTLPLIVAVRSRQVSLAVRAMKAGAFGIIENPYVAGDLEELIDAAMKSADAASQARLQHAERERKLSTLSPREREVLWLIVNGRPNKVAAYELGISPRTAEIHRASVMRKLSCQNVSQITMLALRSGFCSP